MEGKMGDLLKKLQFLERARRSLQGLADELGVEIDFRESENGIGCSVKKDESDARAEFEKYAWKFGYKPEDFGREFVGNGELYRIIGVKPTAEKNCFRILRVKDGKEFVCGKGFAGCYKTPAQMAAMEL
jgi:hypothetical protein